MEKTQYWIIVASKEHVKIGVEGGFAQACHGKAAPLKKIKKGDYVIYYSSKQFFDQKEKCQKFTAMGKVVSGEIYQVQLTNSFTPYRLQVDFLDTKDISILPLIDKLNFIPNKQKWGYPFRRGIVQVEEGDFNLISRLLLDGQRN